MSKYDRYDSVYHIKRAWLEALGGDPEGTLSDYDVSLRILDWYLSHSGGTCEHPIDIIIDVVDTISGYSGTYPMVYDRSQQKWYILNNLYQYEEYGIMPTVEALSATTTYPGKLAILSGATPHEYEFVNGEWNDLGELNVRYGGVFNKNAWFDTGVQTRNNLCVEYEIIPNANFGEMFGSRRNSNTYAFTTFNIANTNNIVYILGSQRTTGSTSDFINKELYSKLWLYTSGTTNTNVKYGAQIKIDGTTVHSASGLTTGANYTASGNGYNLYVGAMCDVGSVNQNKFNGTLKSFKIYENIDANGDGELTHDYTFVNDGGTVKMYDHITDTYYVNKGTGSVTLIPEWTPIKDYTEKDKPISSYSAETYCDLYDISSDLAYVGLYGIVDEDNYIINDEKKWEETSYPTIEYDGLILHANEAGSTVAMTNYGGNTPNLQYSFDGDTWENWDYSEIDLGLGQEVAFRGTNANFSSSSSKYSSFVIGGYVDAKGNIMSLTDGGACTATTIPNTYCFGTLFSGCTGLYDVSELELPATTLKESCYFGLFKGCTNLTSTPELPATSIAEAAYYQMFAKCTSLTTAPYLPATSITKGNVYREMFSGCTSLVNVPSILPATTLGGRAYQGMFYGCTSLIASPILPAATLTGNAYQDMFSNCSRLSGVTMFATNVSATSSLSNWLANTATNGLIVKSTGAFWSDQPASWSIDYSGRTEASVSSINCVSASSSYTITVHTDSYNGNTWTATAPEWCSLSTTAKTGDSTDLVVTVQSNNDDPRTGNVVITATDRTISITVNQDGFGFDFENLYPAYSGTDRYWYVQESQTQQNVTLVLGNQTKEWTLTSAPEWVTVSPTAGTGTTLISLTATPNTINNYREEFVTVSCGSRQANFRVMQYKYPIVLANNLGNKYHTKSDNTPITRANCFGFDLAVGNITTTGYDFTNMKSIVCRTDGWFTNPYALFDQKWGSSKFNNIQSINIDASTIIQAEQAFNFNTNPCWPNCTAVTITNCENITKGLSLSALKSAVSISIGNLPSTSSTGLLLPQTTTLTDLSIGSTYTNKDLTLTGCTNLTVTSLVNVLNALPDITGSTQRTLALGATNKAKLTAEQIEIATNKGWAVT